MLSEMYHFVNIFYMDIADISCQQKGKIKMSKKKQNVNKEYVIYIFRASMTINGITYYARDYGKRAFKIPVRK